MNGNSRTRLAKACAAALLLPLVLASCGGTRLSDAELGLGDTGKTSVVQTVVDGSTLTGSTSAGAASTGAAPPTAATGVGAGTAGTAAKPGGVNGASGAAAAGKPALSTPATPGSLPGTAVTAAGPDAPCTKTLDPINLGQDGTFSGFTQGTLGGYRPGLAAWAADVNARGGVQCHPVKLFQVDDGSNPARTVSNTKDLIENKKVVAMLAAVVPFNMAAYRSVTDPAGIPTLGGDTIDGAWSQDPLIYPTGVTLIPSVLLAMRSSAEATGNKKWSLIYCVEAAPCTALNQASDEMAKQAGVQIVDKQAVSLSQTDYTSNCQTAKNAGAQSVLAGHRELGAHSVLPLVCRHRVLLRRPPRSGWRWERPRQPTRTCRRRT